LSLEELDENEPILILNPLDLTLKAAEKGKLSIEESLIEELIRKGAKEIKAVSSNSMMNF
jgi:hypothetical protein